MKQTSKPSPGKPNAKKTWQTHQPNKPSKPNKPSNQIDLQITQFASEHKAQQIKDIRGTFLFI
jgi:hypothetical protein